MNKTIHINVELHKTDTDYIAITKTRLWAFIPPSLQWIMKTKIPASASIQNGISFMIINNLAILVEGVLTDILIENKDNYELEKSKEIKQLETGTWQVKKQVFEKDFNKSLSSFSEFESINHLFNLRNNFSHGRTHLEKSIRNINTGNLSPLESVNKQYQSVRDFLIERKLISIDENPSNIVFWKFNIAVFFFLEVKKFLFNLISNIEFKSKDSILGELNTAYSVFTI